MVARMLDCHELLVASLPPYTADLHPCKAFLQSSYGLWKHLEPPSMDHLAGAGPSKVEHSWASSTW